MKHFLVASFLFLSVSQLLGQPEGQNFLATSGSERCSLFYEYAENGLAAPGLADNGGRPPMLNPEEQSSWDFITGIRFHF